ncbi:hypothetical protein N6H05_20170 [Sphingobium sp. WTD-1]|uniref:hypothetical protein n=1 Tax=Sphingobium sp. WTD-1 TaxID=2979467 RepID=UPI0024DEFDA8|nr:hypothetical protein [Sphingobium sp. WTD-1]WIA55325.1 hypothetical protein N6H05_20170 [Sphingobium sp. WTD-1]
MMTSYPTISAKAQRFMLWWGWLMMIAFGLSYWLLIRLLPLNPATDTAAQVAAFYQANSLPIRIGAVICSWCAAFAIPIYVVLVAQSIRLEKGIPIWSILQFGGGMMMTIFLVLPPLFWGVAAFSPGRPPEVTLLMHELANLTLVTTDQFFIFNMVPIAYLALSRRGHPLNPFPRWYGYYVVWTALMFEIGAFAFLPRTGPFAWNGLLTYWIPFTIFGVWMTMTLIVLLRAIGQQEAARASHG